jgi:catechol 2,3-dioxygenase-like lactoylglutathione lyase family enzyme
VPRVNRILETALYVEDVPRSAAFYERVFGFPVLTRDERFCALDVAGQVLLLFKRGSSVNPARNERGTIPGHDGSGPLHFAFAIDAAELEAWERRLASLGVPIEGRMTWTRGGRSLYFRDPDGHLVELATPGVWATY